MDWIKLDKKLASGAKMVRLIELTGLPVETLLGRLVRFWSWVDDHVKDDALLNVTSVTTLVVMFGYEEPFWLALCDERVTWLRNGSRGLEIPDWQEWFSASAKTRQTNAERQRRYREGQKAKRKATPKGDDGHATVTPAVTDERDQRRREEKRGEEKILEETLSPPPTSPTASAPAPAPETSKPPATSVPASRGTSLPPTSVALKNLEGKTPPWELVVESCRATVEKLEMSKGKPLDPADRELILKVNALVSLGALSQHEHWDSCEAVARKYKSDDVPKIGRCGYWHSVLTSKLAERGVVFNALLKHVTVPEALLKPRQAG
jgi:hypothetical protein